MLRIEEVNKLTLTNEWSIWYYKCNRNKTWKENLKFFTHVKSVQDLERYVHLNYKRNAFKIIENYFEKSVCSHMESLSKLPLGNDYMFFKVNKCNFKLLYIN